MEIFRKNALIDWHGGGSVREDEITFQSIRFLQPHEAEAFYESSMSLVINGHEWDEYEDGIKPNHATYFKAPGYVFRQLLPPGKIIDIVPAEYRLDYPLLVITSYSIHYTKLYDN